MASISSIRTRRGSSGSPAGAETSIDCRGLPYPRSRSSRIAAIRAVSFFAFSAKRASSAMTAGACWRANSCTSARTLGRSVLRTFRNSHPATVHWHSHNAAPFVREGVLFVVSVGRREGASRWPTTIPERHGTKKLKSRGRISTTETCSGAA